MNSAVGEARIAVIIPTLNEEGTIAAALESLSRQMTQFDRVIVVDGGSTDGTLDIANRYGATIVRVARRGRGCQICAALKGIADDIVVIMHADMVVPPGALSLIRQTLEARPNCPGGCLGHRFDSSDRSLRLTEWWDKRRACRGASFGDQAQFFRRKCLESLGGFPDQPIMEDVELSRRLRRLGRPIYLDYPVVVSARRFARLGWCRAILANYCIRLAYRLCGLRASEALYRRYYGRP
ncbi:MAG: TIGR04283 family arsenosugar biosynthesis glycosyltransferase [Planctomycetia bacterium]|nr:TIGR04283 family arsenosugar biosynthesis glycosyltransferase [Planctomycetia bacterium]